MSLLLKALKQAESANPNKAGAGRPDAPGHRERSLELEPVATSSAGNPAGGAQPNEWVEPPDLLLGSSGLPPAAPPRAPAFRWPHLSLVPLTAMLATLIALGYGIYLYFALQPPAAIEMPPVSDAVPVAAPVVSPAPLEPPPVRTAPIETRTTHVETAPANPETAAHSLPTTQAQQTTSAPAPAMAPTPRANRAAPAPALASTTAPVFRPDMQNSLLSQAYAAYQRGALNEARQLYTQAAARDQSIDALLGLATIASLQNREADAQRFYRQVLDIDPRNAAAQAALLDLLGNTDSQAAESRLKTLIDRDPSPQLYQTLGSFYAEQGRWSDAQAAYFEAYRGAPGNGDYAFNLAVSLDQLHQPQAALMYYEKALASSGVHRFDRTQATARVQQLKSVR